MKSHSRAPADVCLFRMTPVFHGPDSFVFCERSARVLAEVNQRLNEFRRMLVAREGTPRDAFCAGKVASKSSQT